jgi:hypothetical protein
MTSHSELPLPEKIYEECFDVLNDIRVSLSYAMLSEMLHDKPFAMAELNTIYTNYQTLRKAIDIIEKINRQRCEDNLNLKNQCQYYSDRIRRMEDWMSAIGIDATDISEK